MRDGTKKPRPLRAGAFQNSIQKLFLSEIQRVNLRGSFGGFQLHKHPVHAVAARVAANGVLNAFLALALVNELEAAGRILCVLDTSDAADDRRGVDLCVGRKI